MSTTAATPTTNVRGGLTPSVATGTADNPWLRFGQAGDRLVGVMLVIVIAAAIGYIGTDVVAEIQNSVTDNNLSATDDGNQTIYENASESISGGYGSAMSLTDVVFLVLMFGVILTALLAFSMRR